MLKLFYELRTIDFACLMELYAEGNADNARNDYPYDEPQLGILKAEQDFYRYLKDVFFCTKNALYAVWEENGTYISALRLEPYRDGLLLEALETHPQYRASGYAKKLINGVLDVLKQQRVTRVYAHVHKRNIPSLQCHQACGFQRVAEQAVYIDGSVTSRSCTMLAIL